MSRAPGLRLHPRTMPVQSAGADLHGCLLEFQQAHELTDAEMLGLVVEHTGRIARWMLREERHPGEPDHKADEE